MNKEMRLTIVNRHPTDGLQEIEIMGKSDNL
jgi:hypothetical protein